MLAVERQVVLEFVHQHPDQKADIGDAALQHVGRCWGRQRLVAVLTFDDGAVITQDHVTGRTLCQSMSAVRANDFISIGIVAFEFRRFEGDDLHRDIGIKAQATLIYAAVGAVFGGFATGVADADGFAFGFGRWRNVPPQAQLISRSVNQTLLGFAPKKLFGKPVDLELQGIHPLF